MACARYRQSTKSQYHKFFGFESGPLDSDQVRNIPVNIFTNIYIFTEFLLMLKGTYVLSSTLMTGFPTMLIYASERSLFVVAFVLLTQITSPSIKSS